MTIYYTLQVSDHPEAGTSLISTQEVAESWQTVFDGTMDSAKQARFAVEGLARKHKHARVFKGGRNGGKLHYAVYSQAPII